MPIEKVHPISELVAPCHDPCPRPPHARASRVRSARRSQRLAGRRTRPLRAPRCQAGEDRPDHVNAQPGISSVRRARRAARSWTCWQKPGCRLPSAIPADRTSPQVAASSSPAEAAEAPACYEVVGRKARREVFRSDEDCIPSARYPGSCGRLSAARGRVRRHACERIQHRLRIGAGFRGYRITFWISSSTPSPGVHIAAVESAVSPAGRGAYAQRAGDDAYWRPQRPPMQAREGLLFPSVGRRFGVPVERGPARTGRSISTSASDTAFSDRFQLFMDFAVDAGRYRRARLCLLDVHHSRADGPDRGPRGNGLHLNLGVGVGGVDYTDGYCCGYSSSTGSPLRRAVLRRPRHALVRAQPGVLRQLAPDSQPARIREDVASAYGLR